MQGEDFSLNSFFDYFFFLRKQPLLPLHLPYLSSEFSSAQEEINDLSTIKYQSRIQMFNNDRNLLQVYSATSTLLL